MTATRTSQALQELARLCGIQLGYTDTAGRRVRARVDSLLAILTALGHPVDDEVSIHAELARVRDSRANLAIQPVLVLAMDGSASSAMLADRGVDPSRVDVTVVTEQGETRSCSLAQLVRPARAGDPPADADGRISLSLNLSPLRLKVGYHRLAVTGGWVDGEALVLVPPEPRRAVLRDFGVVAPLYALRGDDDWGAGTFTDLGAFAQWLGRHGAGYAGTLPLFAADHHQPVDPSPYLPCSRLFWNELFVDVSALPEALSAEPRSLIQQPDFRADLARLSAQPDVDHAGVMRRKRAALMACADAMETSGDERRTEFERFILDQPELMRYAEFRAVDDAADLRWRSWLSGGGQLLDGAPDGRAVRYHCYVQFAAAQQLAAAAEAGAGLYLDLPVGVHPDGYDAWAHSTEFAHAGVGAPPDAMSSAGQSWGFPPLHPERIRESGYAYVIGCYREVFRYARAIRLDHVLGLQRMFWIPPGGDARSGAYVRYHHEELRAIIAIEAQRVGAVVVGEDLGTVTPEIRRAMDRDGMLHSFVTRFEAREDDPLPQPRRPSAASPGTHDLPKFAAYWSGADIADREARGELRAGEATTERERRAVLRETTAQAAGIGDGEGADISASQVLAATLYSLAAGPAELVIADLGDLLGEFVPDNRPGTGPEAGNWRHRLPVRIGEIATDPDVNAVLDGIRERRTATVGEGASR